MVRTGGKQLVVNQDRNILKKKCMGSHWELNPRYMVPVSIQVYIYMQVCTIIGSKACRLLFLLINNNELVVKCIGRIEPKASDLRFRCSEH